MHGFHVMNLNTSPSSKYFLFALLTFRFYALIHIFATQQVKSSTKASTAVSMMIYSFAWVALMKRRLDYLQQEAGIENGTSCSAIPENCDCCHEDETDDSNGNVDDTKVFNNYRCQFLWVPPSSSHIFIGTQ